MNILLKINEHDPDMVEMWAEPEVMLMSVFHIDCLQSRPLFEKLREDKQVHTNLTIDFTK